MRQTLYMLAVVIPSEILSKATTPCSDWALRAGSTVWGDGCVMSGH